MKQGRRENISIWGIILESSSKTIHLLLSLSLFFFFSFDCPRSTEGRKKVKKGMGFPENLFSLPCNISSIPFSGALNKIH